MTCSALGWIALAYVVASPFVFVFIASLCRAAAIGDRQLGEKRGAAVISIVLRAYGRPSTSHDMIVLDVPRFEISRARVVVTLPPYLFRPASATLARYPGTISKNELIDFLYGDDPEGGPIAARKAIDVKVHAIRRALPFLGITIRSRYSFGYSAEIGNMLEMRMAA